MWSTLYLAEPTTAAMFSDVYLISSAVISCWNISVLPCFREKHTQCDTRTHRRARTHTWPIRYFDVLNMLSVDIDISERCPTFLAINLGQDLEGHSKLCQLLFHFNAVTKINPYPGNRGGGGAWNDRQCGFCRKSHSKQWFETAVTLL